MKKSNTQQAKELIAERTKGVPITATLTETSKSLLDAAQRLDELEEILEASEKLLSKPNKGKDTKKVQMMAQTEFAPSGPALFMGKWDQPKDYPDRQSNRVLRARRNGHTVRATTK